MGYQSESRRRVNNQRYADDTVSITASKEEALVLKSWLDTRL